MDTVLDLNISLKDNIKYSINPQIPEINKIFNHKIGLLNAVY